MVYLSASPELDTQALTLFQTIEPLLSNTPILIFRGPASAAAATSVSSSRIQCHIFTPAGFQSYSRLAISPSSPLYAAVSCLSREDQGDEVCRELAYCMYKYFAELPQEIKDAWIQKSLTAKKPGAALDLFTESHAATIASRAQRVEDAQQAVRDIQSALAPKSLSLLDVDVVLPAGSIAALDAKAEPIDVEDMTRMQYGKYADLIALLGTPAFIPTSRMRRAPSRPTPSNHSVKFTKAEKEAIRREMCELVDTEESYVNKLQDLVKNIAPDLIAAARLEISPRDAERAISILIPHILNDILAINSHFLHALQDVFDRTEADAIRDFETSDTQPTSGLIDDLSKDAIGIDKFSKCLLEHLPKFKNFYSSYFDKHDNSIQMIKNVLQQDESSLASRLVEMGEKRLSSLLIEPIQRLPRYSLYIENISKQLPLKHPALRSILKAKDIVAELCAPETADPNSNKTLTRLKQLVTAWPSNFNPRSRLITAVDLTGLQAPYDAELQPRDATKFIGLLFAEAFVLLQLTPESERTARGFLAEVESGSVAFAQTSMTTDQQSLVFADHAMLHELRMTEMKDGQLLQIVPCSISSKSTAADGFLASNINVFSLRGAYELRASRFTEEFAKARVEGRFTEKERDSGKWHVRELNGHAQYLSLFSAVYEDGRHQKAGNRSTCAQATILIDLEKSKSRDILRNQNRDIIAVLTVAGNGFYRLEVESSFAPRTKDFVTGSELVSVLTKRLFTATQLRGSIRNPLTTSCLLHQYETILRSVHQSSERLGRSPSRSKTLRQHSPVKAIANFFGGSSKSSHEPTSAPPVASIFSTTSAKPNLGTKSASEPLQEHKPVPVIKSAATVVADGPAAGNVNLNEILELALETFVLALRARKGNIIGRVITNRAAADELAVNKLYNALLEHPKDHESSAQAPVDVLFAAFEKFLKVAWRDRFGPVLEYSTLEEMQYKSSVLSPIDFEDYLTKAIDDLIPQNRRALRGIVGLLIDLLDGTGNDGDRGSLMATITEIAVCEGQPHDFMPLFDRFVEEHELILNEGASATTPQYGSTVTRSTNTGSFSSKASSWGKRLGFGSLGRKNSKADGLNSSQLNERPSRGLLERTKSVDWTKSASPLSRPGSRDRPISATPTKESRPGTGRSWDQVEPLESVAESGLKSQASGPRRKRRSSLSDLDALPKVNTSPFWGSPSPRRPEDSPLANRLGSTPLRKETFSVLSRPRPQLDTTVSPSPSRDDEHRSIYLGQASQSGVATVTPLPSPTRANAIRHRSTIKKENMPTVIPSAELSPPPSSMLSRAQSSPSRHKFSSVSGLSLRARAPLSERPGSGNTPPPPTDVQASHTEASHEEMPSKPRTPSPSPVKALHARPRAKTVQSPANAPQKVHERIRDHRDAISQAETSLLSELAKIGAEMAAAPSTPTRMNSRRQETIGGATTGTTPRKENIEGRLRALENKIPHLFRTLGERTKTLEEEVARQMKEKDDRIKELEMRCSR